MTNYAFAAYVLPTYVGELADSSVSCAPAPSLGKGWIVIITDDPGLLNKLQLAGITTKHL